MQTRQTLTTSPRSRSRLVLLAAATLCLLAGAALPAAAAEVAVFGSYWDTSDLGGSAGAGAKLSFGDTWTGNDAFGFEVRATYFPDLGDSFDTFFDIDFLDLDVEALPIDAGVHLAFDTADNVRLFVAGGVSYVLLDANVDIDDELGFYAGGGIEVGNPDFGFFAEALYRNVEATVSGEVEFVGITVRFEDDLDLSGPSANAGVYWRF